MLNVLLITQHMMLMQDGLQWRSLIESAHSGDHGASKNSWLSNASVYCCISCRSATPSLRSR